MLEGKSLADKQLPDTGNPDVVPIVDFAGPQPVDKIFRANVQVVFLNYRQYNLGLIFNFVLKPSKEHPEEIRVSVAAIFLL